VSPQTTLKSESNAPADSDILAAFGGEYSDPALHSYVNAIAQRVAAGSGNSAASVNVTILDTPIVNAFSVVSRGIFVTRGMLAIINDGGAKGRRDVPKIDWYMEGRVNIDDLITHKMPLERINDAFGLMHQGKSIRSVIEY
jgi:Zn-dependent alcohol dehydrogenase